MHTAIAYQSPELVAPQDEISIHRFNQTPKLAWRPPTRPGRFVYLPEWQFASELAKRPQHWHRPVKQAARELIVLKLYRQGEASSGKAAEWLGMERGEFIRYASARGIPHLQISGEELCREVEDSRAL